ncbi:MAG: DegT/DnrJ/EryC1/StrS family aminotransferase, partial [Verrucomicrobiae bacterium]|nr:DegT/DnrJ/EryC1/StrS family aminotransferase [Verrucomicrobiae bacterium]
EDGAQSIGARRHGAGFGAKSDFATYSFFPSKNLGGFGDGGMVVTGDDELAEKARIMRVHGGKPKYYHHVVGGNFRLDALQAALLRVKLARYGEYTESRRRNAAYYTEKLAQIPGVVIADPSGHCHDAVTQARWLAESGAKLVLPAASPHNDHIWNQFTLRVIGEGRRDALRQHLADRQIGCEVYYPLTMDQQPCFRNLPESSRQGCENAHRLASEVISIPIYPELTRAQRDEVIEAVGAFPNAG